MASSPLKSHTLWIAIAATLGVVAHLGLRFSGAVSPSAADWPLLAVLLVGGSALLIELAVDLVHGKWQTDLLAGASIITAVVLHEYLAAVLIVLMLSGGQALESFAVRKASSALAALAKRMPTVAHRKIDGVLNDVVLDKIVVGDLLVVLPHETCPVDGTVVEGHGSMDESYLTGEPYRVSKAVGTNVLSGAMNGETALTIRADRLVGDSRYAKIMQVMEESERNRPQIQRLGDQLGGLYTPFALAVAALAWYFTGSSLRFLAVLVVATPCPLLIAIPVALIGSINAAARRGIVIRDPTVLEQISRCRTAIFDKTGTLTYGRPDLVQILAAPGFDENELLAMAACLERYSKHPLGSAVLLAAEGRRLVPLTATEVSELPGKGLVGVIRGRRIHITGRKSWLGVHAADAAKLPPVVAGMECLIIVDDVYAGVMQFRDRPRESGRPFIKHLAPQHHFQRVLLVSGDRESEVRYLAEQVGIHEVFAGQTPEQKIEIVRRETAAAPTLFVGDGINDAPALHAASVGLAMGTGSDVVADAAGAVLLENSILKVDELIHIGARFRNIALQSAVGGMAFSACGMMAASAGFLPPIAGAVLQEVIDVIAVLNALRASRNPAFHRMSETDSANRRVA